MLSKWTTQLRSIRASTPQKRRRTRLARASLTSALICFLSFAVAAVSPRYSSGEEFEVFLFSAWVLGLVTAPTLIVAAVLAIAAIRARKDTLAPQRYRRALGD